MYRSTIVAIILLVIVYAALIDCKSPATSKNHELMAKMGLQRVRGPNSHHRKRLAVESRHHSRSDDSHMFIIKLPPNQHYYAHNVPNEIDLPSKNIPVGFKSNGKPAKVYHWNLPVIKKIAAKKTGSKNGNSIHNPESWNEILEKDHHEQVERKPLKPSYYIPAKPKKSSMMKYFSGNGKPHSFYVITKSKKAHYHRLLP